MKSKAKSEMLQAKAKAESARLRKQKSRDAMKSSGLVRTRIRIGEGDRNALNLIAEHFGWTVSDLVSSMVREHVKAGVFNMPQETGCLWESQESELDLLLSPEVRDHLYRHSPRLTPGEVIEILLGLLLRPKWDMDDPNLSGSFSFRGEEVIPPRKMMTCAEAHWRRGDRRWQQAMAMGLDREDVWPDRLDAHERAARHRETEWVNTVETGNLAAPRHDVRVYTDDGNVICLRWDDEPDADDLMDEIQWEEAA